MSRIRIIAAAVHLDGLTYCMEPPHRHHHILAKLRSLEESLGSAQGFLLSDGRFVDRVIARSVAIDAGQVKDPTVLHPRHLFSEDLW